MSILTYAKPAVRHAWADVPLAPTTDVVDPGDTYVSQGWQQGAKPPRPYFNWLLNYAAAGVRYYCQNGIPDWDAAEVYQTNSVVTFGNINYQSLQNNNTNQNPSTATAWWGPLRSPTPAANDNSTNLATTAWVHNNFLGVGSTFAAISGLIAAAQVPVGAVTQWQGSLAINFSQLVGSIANNQVPVGAVTQWQSSLSIAWGQITGTKNADQLLGLVPGPDSSYAGSTLARYNASGYLYAAYLNQSSPNNENPTVSQVLVTNGTDNFLRKSSVANLLQFLGGSQTLGGTGHVTLPGGVIINWGVTLYTGSGNSLVATFEKTFPTSCLWAMCICQIGGFTPGVGSFNSSQLTMTTNGLGGTQQLFYWVAIGY